MARCVIVSAGAISPEMKQYFLPGDTVIACDAGYKNCALLGVKPDILLGDFDTAPCPEESDALILPHVKDDTDTHYAAKIAAERQFEEALLLGALGGKRMDHTMANLATGLWLERHGVKAVLRDACTKISYVLPGREYCFPRSEWKYFSVFPLEGTAAGVTLCGAFYPLQDAVLTADFPLGVSNEWVEEMITVKVQKGALLVMETQADW